MMPHWTAQAPPTLRQDAGSLIFICLFFLALIGLFIWWLKR